MKDNKPARTFEQEIKRTSVEKLVGLIWKRGIGSSVKKGRSSTKMGSGGQRRGVKRIGAFLKTDSFFKDEKERGERGLGPF